MYIISPVFRGEWRAVIEAAREAAFPWGMPCIDAVELTPKVHQMPWYTSGFI